MGYYYLRQKECLGYLLLIIYYLLLSIIYSEKATFFKSLRGVNFFNNSREVRSRTNNEPAKPKELIEIF